MKHLFILIYVWVLARFNALLLLSNPTIKLFYIPGFNKLRHFNAKAKAYAEFVKAKRQVPAYLDFLKSNRFSMPTFKGVTPNIHEIPVANKENYIKRYTLDERCTKGELPATGVVIDESSGSSGSATNWARGHSERKTNARMIDFGMRNLFGNQPLFLINAFALGAWATGVNIAMSCVKFAKIKSTGPDRAKIENTIRYFGRKHKYVIMGYPPFLKSLVDDAGLDWQELDVSFIFGGEPMAEEMRDFLVAKGIKKIYSSLGASDLELNLAAENDFTIELRKLLRSNVGLRNRILKYTGALPMIFQYNPTDFLINVAGSGELIFTVCRPNYVAPKIRYNLKDKGHVLQIRQLRAILKEFNINKNELIKPQTDLPLLFHYGRVDMTVSFFGANISPVDIQETICKIPKLMEEVNSFSLQINEDTQGNKQLVVALEMQQKSNVQLINKEQVQKVFFDELANINQDFREAKEMLNNPSLLQINFYAFAQGPFIDADIRIKAKYIRQGLN